MAIIPTKEEEAALREAATGSSNSSNPHDRSSSQLSLSTTDYESARSYNDGESQLGDDILAAANQTASADVASVDTLQQVDTTAGSEEIFAQTQDTVLKNVATPRDFETTISQQPSENEEKLFQPSDDDYATDPVPLDRVKSIQSLARSRKSFDSDSRFGMPATEEPDYLMNQSDAYHLALTRTVSRKSLSRKSLKSDAQKSILEVQEDEGVDPSTLEWDGADDKDDPKNWSPAKKWTITMVTAAICLVVSLGSSLYVCGVPDLVVEFGVSQELAISGLTFYLVGLAFGPVLAAPMSEVLGRRIVYIISLPVSMLFIMGVGLSKNIGSILVLRFFAGFFASPAMAVAGGTIADMWNFESMGLAMAGFCLAPFMGPVLGPIIGGFVAQNKGWKWTMWVNLMFAGAILLPVLAAPETYKPILLKRRAKKRGIKLAKPTATAMETLKFIVFLTLMTPLKMLFVEPIVMVFSIYIAFVFAVLFGFFEAYPIIFRGVYHMGLGVSGLSFVGVMIGFIIGTVFYVFMDRYYFFKIQEDGTRTPKDENGKPIMPVPESRLILCKIGAIAMPISLFWLGWTSKSSVHWISAVIAGVPFGFGLILIFFSTIIYFSMSYPPLSLASALAANNLFRYLLASVFPLFVVQMYDRLHINWASSLFAFIALAMVPVPWCFERWGPQLRAKSTYGYAAMFKKAQEENARLAALQEEVEEEVLNEIEVSNSSTDYKEENSNSV